MPTIHSVNSGFAKRENARLFQELQAQVSSSSEPSTPVSVSEPSEYLAVHDASDRDNPSQLW